jgi:hypothetical protein
MNVDIGNQFHNHFHQYHRLCLTESICYFLYYFDGGKYLLIYIYYCRTYMGATIEL